AARPAPPRAAHGRRHARRALPRRAFPSSADPRPSQSRRTDRVHPAQLGGRATRGTMRGFSFWVGAAKTERPRTLLLPRVPCRMAGSSRVPPSPTSDDHAAFSLRPPIAPMLAKNMDVLPSGAGFLYEPKWDGFR